MTIRRMSPVLCLVALALVLATILAQASSHREAPLIAEFPKVDGTDFYMFRSYEPGRENFVTIVANYIPLQVPYGGPNFFSFDPDALYEIHLDNNGDAQEDLTFQFRFQNTLHDLALTGWMTASLRQGRALNAVPSTLPQQRDASVEGGAWTQVSRLSAPLINELVIGLKDKDRFNASEPVSDGQFADYVTNPSLAAIIEALFGAPACGPPH